MKAGERYRPKPQFEANEFFNLTIVEMELLKYLGKDVWKTVCYYNQDKLSSEFEMTGQQIVDNWDKIG